MADNTQTQENQNENENTESKGKMFEVDDITDWQTNANFIEPKARKEADAPVGEPTDEEEKEGEDEDEDEEVEVKPSNQPEIQLVPDPGTFTPKDYSFTVELASGKTVTIRTPEQADEIGDDPENFETPKQLLDFVRKSQKMQLQIDKDRDEYDKQKAAFDEQKELIELISQEETRIKNEFAYLVDNGDLPKLPKNSESIEWAKSKDPAIKEHMAIIRFMEKESAKRQAKGLAPITSPIDAFAAYQVQQAKKNKSKSQQEAGEQRKANSARIAGSSPSPVGYQPKGIAIGRVGNLRNMGTGWDV